MWNTDVDAKTNLLFVRGRNSYPPLPSYAFFNFITQAGLSHIKPVTIQNFGLDLLVLVEFVLPC